MWIQGLTIERGSKRQRTSQGSRIDVVCAAKIAQSIVKVYASMDVASAKSEELEDLVLAMDLACMALYVVCVLEHIVRLGDLVIDNLLYQVAKKYAEMPEMRESASCVAACVHVRLWDEHTKLSKDCIGAYTEQSKLMACFQDAVSTDVATRVTKKLILLAEFPRPELFHSAHFSRLLLSHTNTCLTLLFAVRNHEAMRLVAESTLSPWIDHLKMLPGHTKLASSFSDRAFRVLWKAAAAMDSEDRNSFEAVSYALSLRSTALIFMLKSSKYTPIYFIQQVHRVGVQHECASKRSQQGLQDICAFYDRSADALFQTLPSSKQVYESESLQWEYIQWLEHFAVVCESLEMLMKSAMILENAMRYARTFGSLGKSIQSCLLFCITSVLLGISNSKKPQESLCLRDSAFDKRLTAGAGKTIRDLVCSTTLDKLADQCESSARRYLKKFEMVVASSFGSTGWQTSPGLGKFVIRCLKRSSIKVFNYTISIQQCAQYQLLHQIVTSFAEMCKAVKKLRSSAELDMKMIESLILEESRLHRMAVILLARRFGDACSSTPTTPALHAIICHVNLLRELLDDATMGEKPNVAILQGIFGDLMSIGRECYSCAIRCYKIENYQDTVLALTGAFELAEKYLEYIMCSDATADDINRAHAQLKVDDIASLLAYCFHKMRDVTRSRIFAGYSLVYCGDIQLKNPQANIEKYVSCVLDELKLLKGGTKCSIASFKAFFDNTTHVFTSRHVSEDRLVMLWSTFQYAFECSSVGLMGRIRADDNVASAHAVGTSSECVELCGALQSYLDRELMKMKLKATDGAVFGDTLLDVSQSLAKRKLIYCSYYAKRDLSVAMKGLLYVHDSLTDAADRLQSFVGSVSVDLGGVYGWRGVITMEITLMASYAGIAKGDVCRGNIRICEGSALADIEQCLKYWNGEDVSGFLFNETYMVCCLNSICNTLSLISYSPLEKSARKLLKKLQGSVNVQGAIAPPAFWLFCSGFEDNGFIAKSEVVAPNADINMQLFEQVDQELIAAQTSCFGCARGRTCQHLLRATTVLGNIKPMRQCEVALVAKAIGMRELFIHAILSDFYFHEGQSKCAIEEAKAALRVCWKMAKKCTVLPSSVNTEHFKLPLEISTAEGHQRNLTHVLYFMALESSSWDVLFAAKLMLCRIASLYSLCNQPQRATTCLTEAMRLVGGLNLHLFCRSPFYKYAELELNANQLEKVKIAISLLSLYQKLDPQRSVGAMVCGRHDYIELNVAFIEQKCNEIVQQGDVHNNQGNHQEALVCFAEAVNTLEAIKGREPTLPKSLKRVKARCWRKYTRLQSQVSDFADTKAVEALLVTMKRLKQSMKTCDVHLERVKCLLELGRINLSLLRSASPQVFTSLRQTLAFLEEAYMLGDHLGIPHLSQELRVALGLAYFAEIEENARSDVDCTKDSNRCLPWMSSVLLANPGSASIKEAFAEETNSSSSTRTALTMQLEALAARSTASHEMVTHTHLIKTAESIAEQVRELPDNWAIVSVMMTSSSELVITRILTNNPTPVSFCLPKAAWTKPIREMDAIIQDSREGLSGYTAEEARFWDSEQKNRWWSTRKLLDERVEKALALMEKTLGFWRCLFVGGAGSLKTNRAQRCWELLVSSKTGSAKLVEKNQTLLCAIANAQQYLSDTEVIDALNYIAAEIGVFASDSTIQEALHVLRMKREDLMPSLSKAAVSNLAKLSREKIARMKISELMQLLAAEGLSADGLKKAMVERLLSARSAVLANGLESSAKISHDDIDTHFSTILILHHELQQFPWEGMDVMRCCSGITRMPSLDLILDNAKRLSSVRRDRVCFLLNPAGDLKSTQRQLSPIVERGTTKYNWEGIVGKIPDPDDLRCRLMAADLFIYCGHGSGEVYLHRDKILSLQPDCTAALLFGCSSGRLEREGIFGPSGAALAYLHAGSPAVLAMLWDVTDRDIDQLSVRVLQKWLLTNDGDANPCLSLAEILQESRSVCKLKYLNGHAAICYGLPLYVATS
ncbi:unnamed protein product [Peronospora belbahrii]|uniref:separase n=1 Tax=Peronospora belbahrii TaxID=622444 RepID=A0AAU9KYR5_9STRA|nr:unnamed protein product [Peronospora belbahrii]CAH0517971.1 unnamed protein product [Peronospora belbahrii]